MLSPFRGLRYAPGVAGDLALVTSPPYDAVDPEARRRLAAATPHSIINVMLPPDGNYDAAARRWTRYLREGIVVTDPVPRMYLYTMEFLGPEGVEHHAVGVVAALDVVPFGEGVVPHEDTIGPFDPDRLAFYERVGLDVDPIMALAPTERLGPLLAPTEAAVVDFEVAGVRHRLSPISDPDHIEAISAVVDRVAIADGHHRYVTALVHAERHGPRRILAMVLPAEGSGLVIGPYHRVISGAPGFGAEAPSDLFSVERIAPGTVPQRPGDLVIVTGGSWWRLRPHPDALAPLPEPWRAAGTAVARELLFPRLGITADRIRYVPDTETAVAAAATPDAIAVLVAPIPEHAVAEAGRMGIRFPEKSTFFTPKPRAGVVMRSLSEDRELRRDAPPDGHRSASA